MPCKVVNCSTTLLIMGAASQVNGSSSGSIPELLNNLWSNATRLCIELKQHNDMCCTDAYGTKDAHDAKIRDANKIV